MSVTERFNVATWNFVLGQRDVEEALRDPSIRALVVRGGVGTVLPTICAVREMEAREGLPARAVHVPSNALSAALPDLAAPTSDAELLPLLLRDTYGVRVAARPAFEGVVVAFLSDDPSPAAVAALRSALEEAPCLVGMPGTRPVREDVRPLLARAASTFRYGGRNAFFCAAVEEAVWELAPSRICVLAEHPMRLFYTAIGAADWFLLDDATRRDPSSLQAWDLTSLGSRVTACLADETRWASAADVSGTVLERVCGHLERALGVASCAPDFGYGPVAGHKIAIDVR